MSDAEHLIENAICSLEQNKTYEEFVDVRVNMEMAIESNINLQDIWNMATYVVCTAKRYWVMDTISYLKGEKLSDEKMKDYIEEFI